ncbi:MAG: hypothetical protein ACKVON_13740 [Beijerinckiaceae bacterium]
MRVLAIMTVLVLPIAACGHREKKAPCSPSDGVTSQQPLAYAPLSKAPQLPFELTTDCGPLKSMNPIPLDELPPSVRARP